MNSWIAVNNIDDVPKTSGIYYLDFPNGKKYVGQSINLNERLKRHSKCKGKQMVSYALKKYGGVKNVKFFYITCGIDELDELERLYIKEFDTLIDNGRGYNKETGGSLNKKMSEETKLKLSLKHKEHYKNPEARKKNSEAQKKVYLDDPTRALKVSEKQKKRFADPLLRKEISDRQKERFKDPEIRRQTAEKTKDYFKNPEARARQSEAQKKRFSNPLEVEKMKRSKKEYYKTHSHPLNQSIKMLNTLTNEVFEFEKKQDWVSYMGYNHNSRFYGLIKQKQNKHWKVVKDE